MSGGSMDYFYGKLDDAAEQFALTTMERVALRSHMLKLSKALKAVEWNDSGDGANDESELIRECLAPKEVLSVTLSKAEEVLCALQDEIIRARKEAQ